MNSLFTEAGVRGVSGRRAKIWRPLSRSIASAPEPPPADRICEASAERVAEGPAACAAAGGSAAAASSTAMRRYIRAIRRSRVGNPPVAAKSRLRSARSHAIVRAMVFRRELLPILLAVAFLLVGPAQAPASPEWLGAEPLDATLNATVPADVAADADGNAVAVWLAGGEVRSAYRPRGGPWGAPESLDPGVPVVATQPRVTVQPNGQFVAVWFKDRVDTEAGYPLRWARRPAGGGWSDPALITGIGCCPGITALEANADGSGLLVATDEGTGTSFRKPPGSETWGPGEPLPSGQNHRVAVAPDGSAAAAIARGCPSNGELQCVVAAFRPPGGPWGEYEEVARVSDGSQATGWEIAATPSSGFTVMWGEATNSDTGPVAPGAVRSADRAPGLGAGWGSAETAVALADDIPFCNFANCFDLAVRADGVRFGAWHQTGAGGNQIGGVVGTPGTWGFPQLVGETGTSSATPFVVFAASTGLPVVVWGSNVRGQGVPHGA